MAVPSLRRWQVHLLMFFSTSLVATSFIVVKTITNALNPSSLVLLRFVFAAALFFPFISWKHGIKIPERKTLLGYSLISGSLVAFFWLMFLSLRYTTALNTGVIFTLVPGLSGIFGFFLVGEKLGKFRIATLIPATFGAIWVIFRGDIEQLLAMQLNGGDLLFLAACFFMALYMPLVKKFHRGEPMEIMTFWILITGSCWLLLLGGVQLVQINWNEIAARVWAGVVYLSFFTTIVTFFISQWATLHLGPTRVISYSYLYPPLIIVLEWTLGHGLPPFKTLFGVLLIVSAMFILQREDHSKI